jgi:hypothetical protein
MKAPCGAQGYRDAAAPLEKMIGIGCGIHPWHDAAHRRKTIISPAGQQWVIIGNLGMHNGAGLFFFQRLSVIKKRMRATNCVPCDLNTY